MKREPDPSHLVNGLHSVRAPSMRHPAGTPRIRLTARQRRAAEQDWGYFEVELLAHLIEEAPHLLVGPWRLVHELVRASDRYWMYGTTTVGQLEDGLAEPRAYVDIDALHADWPALKTRVWLAS